MKRVIILIALIIISGSLFSQAWMQYLPQNRDESSWTYYDYQAAFKEWCRELKIDHEGYYINRSGVRQKAYGWKQFKRWEIVVEGTYDPKTGRFLDEVIGSEINRHFDAMQANRNIGGNWTNIAYSEEGDGNNGNGRINCVAFHPTDPNTFWIGAAWGGIWSTTDHGETWTPLSDFIKAIGIGSIGIPHDYSTSHTIYLGTGDRGYIRDRGIGLLKSTNSGATWENTGLVIPEPESFYILRILIDPSNSNIIYAGTTRGLCKSLDAGATWDTLNLNKIADMEFNPDDPQTIYAGTRHTPGDDSTRIIVSTDGGLNWDTVFTVRGNRTELAVSADDPSVVYGISGAHGGAMKAIAKSVDAGETFTMILDGDIPGNNLTYGCNPNGEGGQSHYDLAIAADQENADVVFIGGVEAWKSSDGGASWVLNTDGYGRCTLINLNVHVDQHYQAFQPVTNDFFICSDGGIYYSTNNGNSYTNISGGLTINQPYKIGCTFAPGEILMGQQDNGIVLSSNGDVSFVGGGDGGTAVINPESVLKQYYTNNSRGVWGTIDHWGSNFDIYPANDSSDNWFKPIIVLPPDTVLIGYTDLWRSHDNGQTLFKVHDFDEPGDIDDIAVAASNHKVMVVDFNNHIYKTTNGGDTWTDMTSVWGVVPEKCTETVFKHNDPDVIWITDVQWGDGKGVLRSDDGGLTWENISEGLPDASYSDLIQNKNQTNYEELYVCGFFGVFLKLGDNPWVPFNNGLPNVVSFDMDAHYLFSGGKLRTGTHGRGVWETDFYSAEANMPGIWTGVQDENWYDTRNWAYLEVPLAGTDVTIPADCPHYPMLIEDNVSCKSLTIEESAQVSIYWSTIEIAEDMINHGEIHMAGPAGQLNKLIVHGNISWEEGSDFSSNMLDNNQIILYHDLSFMPGSQSIHLDYIDVFFMGDDFSTLYSNGNDCRFGNLHISKTSGKSVSIASSSTTKLIIYGDLNVNENARLFHNSSMDLDIYGNISAIGDLFFMLGKANLAGLSKTIYLANSSSYFNDVEIQKGTAFSCTLLSDLQVRGDFILSTGIFNTDEFNLKLDKDLVKTDGNLLQGAGRIVFDGTGPQNITGTDYDIGMMEIAKSSDTLFIQEDLSFTSSSYYYTSGILEIAGNASVVFSDLAQGGIYGHFILKDNGIINLYQDASNSVSLSGIIKISGGVFNVYGGNIASRWPGSVNAEIHMSGGTLDFKDRGIFILDHPTYTLLDNITGGVIRTSGGFQGDHHAFNPAGGVIELYGPNNADLGHGIGSSFHKIVINKSSDARSNKVTVLNNLDIDNNVVIATGELDINGYTVDVSGLLDISGKLTMTNPASVLNIGTMVSWNSGSSSNITEGLITFKTAWQFRNGTNAQLSGNNTVKATGSSSTDIYHKDADAGFANFVTDKTSLPVYLDGASAYPMRVGGNLTLGIGDMLRVDVADLVVTGTLTTDATSTLTTQAGGSIIAGNSIINNTLNLVNGFSYTGTSMTLDGTMNLTTGGTLSLDNFTLNATLDINAGSVAVHNSFTQATGGHMILDGGSFIIDKPYTGTMFGFSGTTDLNGGFFEISYDGIQFGTGAVVNFNGGNLRVGGHFTATNPNSFQPSAGAVEFINTIGSNITCNNGNYFHKVIINKNAGANPCLLVAPAIIQDDLVLQSGELSTLNQTLTVNDDVLIDAAGRLSPGSGTINVGGNWTNNRGTTGFVESTSSVWLISAQPSTISSETFYNLDFDKNLGWNQFVDMAAGSVLNISNKLTVGDGTLRMNNNCTLNLNGDLHLKSGGGLNANAVATGTVINCYGNWEDYNPVWSVFVGFASGQSTFYFKGAETQEISATGGVNFYNLVFQKTAESVIPYCNFSVVNDFNLVSGQWRYAVNNLKFTFKGNFTISDPALWMDQVNTLSFEGESYQTLTNSSQNWLNLGTLQADKPGSAGELNILSDISCSNKLKIRNGSVTIDSYRLQCEDSLVVETDGNLTFYDDVSIGMGDDACIYIDGGRINLWGNIAGRPLVTRSSTGYYEFLVENGGEIDALYTDFEYMIGRGLDIEGTGIIGGALPLNYCSFKKGQASGTLLMINNSQDVTLNNVSFPTNTWSGTNNVSKNVNTGNVYLPDASGNFAGPFFEYDPNNRIHWPSTGIWDGDVSTEWHNAQNWRYNFQSPNANTDVIIPSGKPNYPVFTQVETTINSLKMEPNTSLTIQKDSLMVTSWTDIRGSLNLTADYTSLFTDSLAWQAGSSANLVSKSTIYISGNMFIKRGSNLDLTNGEIRFMGDGESQLICHDTARIYLLFNYKNAPYSLSLVGDTIARLTIAGSFRNGPGATLRCPSTQEWVFEGSLRNTDGGHFRCENGSLRLRGGLTPSSFKINAGDYFHTLIFETMGLVDLSNTYSDTLRVNGDLVINPRAGYTSGIKANNFKIMLRGDWINNAGSTAFVTGVGQAHQVHFWEPYERQEIRGNTNFSGVFIYNESYNGVHVYDVVNVSSMMVANPVYSHGTLTISYANIDDNLSAIHLLEGSNMTINSLYQGGLIHNHGGTLTVEDLAQNYITGSYIVDAGLTFLKQAEYTSTSTHDLYYANLTINGGELRLMGGHNLIKWPSVASATSSLTMTGGLFYPMGHSIEIIPGNFTENISGGTLRVPYNFFAGAGVTSFHPTGGVVELYDDSDADFGFAEPQCWFYDLFVNKAGGAGAYPTPNLKIKHELRLVSGIMQLYGNPVIVGP